MEISRFEYGYYRESRMQDYHLQRFCKSEGVDQDYLGCLIENSDQRGVFRRILKLLACKFLACNRPVHPLQNKNDLAYQKRLVV